jgi:outer membrane protein OmpA-like peptidoglycan-associated protein/Tol biopolymer transport system component
MKKILILILLPIITFTQDVEIKNLEINFSGDDFAPYLTRNKRELYFTKENGNQGQLVFISKSDNMNFKNSSRLAGDINSGKENGAIAITPDGQYMIFSAYENGFGGEGRTDLYSARKVNGKWTDIQNLGIAVNSNAWDSNPTLSSDGKTLYFSSDREGGAGGADIYMSNKTREGWTKAKNVKEINSSSDDLTPNIAHDNSTFSFSSNRSGGEGNYDIYFSSVNNGRFTSPKNAGSKINTKYNEYSYYIIANTKNAYLCSDRPGGKGEIDIYSVNPNPHKSNPIVNVYGEVADGLTGEKIGADMIVTDLETGKEQAIMKSDDVDGEYYVVLMPNQDYSITADKENYVFHSEEFDLKDSKEGYDLKKNIELFPISKGKTRLMVFFDFDKSTLQNKSSTELDRLTRFLNLYPEINIRLDGHTDDQGSDDYNNKLSKDRAMSVKNKLVENGINPSRIKTEGFGKKKPLINSKTEDARAQNRRVEMVII